MKKEAVARNPFEVFRNVRVLTLMALFAAMSIVFGKLLAVNIGGTIRVSFENLPLLMAGIFLGAPAGFITGVVADLIGCMIAGYSVNPIITLGAGCIGLIAGQLFRMTEGQKLPFRVYGSVMTAHIFASMIIKSAGLMIYYHYTLLAVVPRIPLYLVIGAAESTLILMLMKNRAFSEQLGRMLKK